MSPRRGRPMRRRGCGWMKRCCWRGRPATGFWPPPIMHDLGEVNLYERTYAAARECFEESVVLARQAGDDWWAARAITSLGRIAGLQGDLPHASALAAEALATLRERVSPPPIPDCLYLLPRPPTS